MKKSHILFWVILFIGTLLRVWQLESVPPGIHADEADTGYSAYSLIKTGLDPHGEFSLFALSDSNIGGTHPPIYTYLLIPLVKLFELNIFVVRFPSAFFGSLSIILVFFITKRLFRSNKLSFIVATLFMLNPWAFHISRQGLLEAYSLFFVLLGTLLFLYANSKKYLYLLSAFVFGISVYSYDAPKIFLPPFLLLLVWFKWEHLKSAKKFLVMSAVIFGCFYLSLIKLTFFEGDIKDYNRSSVFHSIAEIVDIEREQTNAPLFLSSIFHNKITVAVKKFETSYFNVFSVNWLFINGSSSQQRSDGRHGQFYLFELPFFFLGLYLAFKKNVKLGVFLLAWMMLGALPGGVTTGNYEYRSILILPIPIIFSSLGILWLLNWIKSNVMRSRLLLYLVLIFGMGVYIASYFYTYFFDYPVYASESWARQQNDAIRYVISEEDKYDQIFVDGGEPWAVTYAFYKKIDPKTYIHAYNNQKDYKGTKVIRINNVYFGIFSKLDQDSKLLESFPKNSLVVTNSTKFINEKNLKAFYDPGKVRVVFKAFQVK